MALLVAAAFALASLERLIPNPLPMVRLGLGNIMTLAAFALMGVRAGVWVSVGRVALVALVWGGVLGPGAVMSASGAAASLLVMVPMLLSGAFSLYGVSIAGAYAHVAGQLTVASLLYVGTGNLFILLPVMGGMAVLTGLFNAWIAIWLISRTPAGLELQEKE
jgi:heptaprenyl diphosphate synthase